MWDFYRSLSWFALAATIACVLSAQSAAAQPSGGFVYALRQATSGQNEIHAFSVDPSTGVLTAVEGSPFLTGGNGGTGALNSKALVYDPVWARLYAANDGSDTISAFALNRSTGALIPLPFSPIPLPIAADSWPCVEVSPNGSILVAGSTTGNVATFVVTATGATPSPGSPISLSSVMSSCEFSHDGHYFYAGPSQASIHGLLVSPETGSLTVLSGSPFDSGGSAPTAFTTDASGRLFVTDHGTGQIRVFSTTAGGLSAVSGNPFESGLGPLSAVHGLRHPTGAYLVADRGHNAVGVYTVGGTGSATTVTPVAGSPFATGGSSANTLALDPSGSLLFVGHLSSRNIQTFRVNSNLTLTSLALQSADTVGTSGRLTGLAFVPQAPSLQIVEFPLPANSRPRGIAVGPDGNIWFTEIGTNSIGRITPAGVITEFPIPTANSVPEGITLGPDGNLWFAESNSSRIGRITPAGAITEFPLPLGGSQPSYLAVGSDGNVWFTEFTGDRIGRITTAGVITEFTVSSGSGPFGMTNGPDGNLWFTLLNGSGVGRITTSGVVTEFPLGTINNLPFDITTGPDGALWFSKLGAAGTGRITTSGSLTEFAPASSNYAGITEGPDGHLWSSNIRVQRRMPGGGVTEYIPPNSAQAGHITTGPDGNMWYTAFLANRIGKVILPSVAFSVVKDGTAAGTVTATVGRTQRINCGTTCDASIPDGAVLTLTAIPAPGARFAGWSGGGCSGTQACVLTLTGNTTVTATFHAIPAMSLTPSIVNFTATNPVQPGLSTPPQTLRLTQRGGPPAPWMVTATHSWISVSPRYGVGPATLTVSIDHADPTMPVSGTVAGSVTITTIGATSPTTASVNLTTVPTSQLIAPFGWFDGPPDGTTGVTGSIAVTGWALDDVGVNRVRILRDPVSGETPGVPVYIGDGVFIAGARPDVAAAFPTRPFFDRAGWGIMVLTNFLPNQGNGTFRLYAYADDLEGNTTLLGAKTITCANATSTTPFGAIDTPAQGGVASGSTFINFGWALTPPPKAIPTDGSTITVYLDSASIGPLTSYNHARPDIQALFPGYANTDGAVGYKFIDTTALDDGLHTISWVVTDNHGVSAGVGSRFFTVSNSTVSGGVTAAPVIVSPARRGTGQAAAIEAESATIAETAAAQPSLAWSDEALTVKYGFGDNHVNAVVAPGSDGVRRVQMRPDERIVVELGRVDGVAARYRGYSIVDGQWRALPVGSTLDKETGRFQWAPPLGFAGTHALVFVRDVDGQSEHLRVDVSIEFPAVRAGAQMHVDLPEPGATVPRSFMVAGWALDSSGPPNSIGIDSLHVWAHPIDGSAPVWVGVAKPGGARPDVASVFGMRFLRSGFAIEATGLPRGTYDLVVYAHSIVGSWFSVAQAVRVTVR